MLLTLCAIKSISIVINIRQHWWITISWWEND